MEESEAVGHRQPQKKNRQETNDSYSSQKKKGEVELERARLSEALRRRCECGETPGSIPRVLFARQSVLRSDSEDDLEQQLEQQREEVRSGKTEISQEAGKHVGARARSYRS